jgi:2-phosphosulfolactate phosphatase
LQRGLLPPGGLGADTGPVSVHVRYLSIAQCRAGGGDVAVVVDVVRAFTTAAWAFHLGVERVVLTDDLDEALRLKAALPGALALKDGEPAPGFDLTNSPAQMQRLLGLEGRTIVQRTSHGTIGAVAARDARRLYCAGFVCAAATAAAIRSEPCDEVCFVVTGEEGRAPEDLACARYIAALLAGELPDVTPYLREVEGSSAAQRVRAAAAGGSGGFEAEDVPLCMDVDRFGFAMRAGKEGGLLVLRRH